MLLPSNAELIEKLRCWQGDFIQRSEERVKRTGEVFTPTELVIEILDKLPKKSFQDPSQTFFDGSCGNGQFLSVVLIRKLEHGHSFESALRTIYGMDIMFDNVELCRDRLLCGVSELRYIVEHNIICADMLNFDFEGWEDAPLTAPISLKNG
jgi:hypothetical protein